jgi:flagellar M-ring protein FliF
MDAAVTALTPANEAALLAAATPDGPVGRPAATGPLARLHALPLRNKAMLGAGTAGLLALGLALLLWSRAVPMTPLFAHTLPENEAGAVIEQLNKLGEAYQLGTLGSLIMVPTERVSELRMRLATLGLPRSAPSGYEVMDNKTSFGKSQTQERVDLQRALGSRLEQQIATISSVQSAKVRVALTGQNGYFRDQDKPSASVALNLFPGRTLDRSQIAGIVHMTAMAVPGLSAKAVTITDQDGNWLTQPDGEGRSDLTQQQRAQLRDTETRLLKNVREVLEPALGADNLRATVTAELDFNQIESTSEAYGANKGADQKATVRSERSTEAGPSNTPQPTGVPGAASNQPATPATAPVTGGASAPLQAAQTGNTGAAARRESQVNYEVDKRVELQRNAVGNIKRINVAVLVNHRGGVDAKGKPTSMPLPPEEIEKLTALVQEAVGFKKERGDSVRVVNIPFRAEPKVEPEPVPVYRQPWLLDLLRAGAVPAAMTLMAMMLLFGVVRPALRVEKVEAQTPESKLDAVVDDVQALPGAVADAQLLIEGAKVDKQLLDARAMALENPQAVANILRTWVNGEDA